MGYTAPAGSFESSYQIIRELGSGGEGKVYLVRHRMTEQLRAAKQLPQKDGDGRLHELNMMKKLRHDALPEVIDVLEEADCIWLILTYIRGEKFQELCAQELPAEIFFRAARQLAEVLCYLHLRDAPVLHLDIKPSNLLIKKDGSLVLIDFGAAVRGHPDIVPERCCGTPGFAAPEQYQKGHRLDMRTDIYGYGAVLYYLLYRRTYQCGADGAFPLMRDGWRKDAGRILKKCLETDMENRYPDSRALYLAVCRAEKHYYRKKQYQKMAGAGVFLIVFLLFCIKVWSISYAEQTVREERSFESLLAEAEGLGFAQAGGCYERAASLAPGEARLYFHFLRRVVRDEKFDAAEERELQKLLYAFYPEQQMTAEELLKQKKESYGELAYELGLAYWYFYEASGGKTAAAKWFEEAVAYLPYRNERKKELEEAAQIHLRIAGYYEKLGSAGNESDEKHADYWDLWRDLLELWKSDGFRKESVQIRRQAAKELLACVVMEAGELKQKGEKKEEVQKVIEELQVFEELKEQCQAAEAALERAYAKKERGVQEK